MTLEEFILAYDPDDSLLESSLLSLLRAVLTEHVDDGKDRVPPPVTKQDLEAWTEGPDELDDVDAIWNHYRRHFS